MSNVGAQTSKSSEAESFLSIYANYIAFRQTAPLNPFLHLLTLFRLKHNSFSPIDFQEFLSVVRASGCDV